MNLNRRQFAKILAALPIIGRYCGPALAEASIVLAVGWPTRRDDHKSTFGWDSDKKYKRVRTDSIIRRGALVVYDTDSRDGKDGFRTSAILASIPTVRDWRVFIAAARGA